jgi:hypothetical protein
MLRNNTEYGLRIYESKIPLTPINDYTKINVTASDTIKNVPTKGVKTPALQNNKQNQQPKK